ncbi:WXG100 family type VII secretion target [Saccharomonospora xinjiangensis]|uniref:WXG100 family type VII secretion target n=1 Tax=Saccharomonospora xinjiangensis TaxID=75294 RepID=UPI003510877F
MTIEVTDVAGSVELKGDAEKSFGDNALDLAKKVPVAKQAVKGYATVTNIWKGLPEDPDVADVMLHAGDVITDTASFAAECAMEAGMAVLDPVGWLVSNGLNIVLHLVTPLQDALHMVSGDGPALSTASGDFAAIGNGLVEYAGEFVRVADEALAEWQGEASDTARRALADFAKGIEGVATSAGGVAEILKTSSMLMTIVEEVVKAIITEFVTWLIWIWVPALASSVVSLGSSVAAAMTASVAKAASTFSRVTSKMGKLGTLLEKILEFFRKFGSTMVSLGEKLGVTPKNYGANVLETVAEAGRGGAMRTAVTESLKAGASQIAKSTMGIDPSGAPANGVQAGKTIIDHTGKLVDHTKGLKDASDKGGIGSGATPDETRELLDM